MIRFNSVYKIGTEIVDFMLCLILCQIPLNPFPDTLLVPLKPIRGSTGPYDFLYSKPGDFYIEKIFVGPMDPFVADIYRVHWTHK